MKNFILVIALCLFYKSSISQDTLSIVYYKKQYYQETSDPLKAKYCIIKFKDQRGQIQNIYQELNEGLVLESKAYDEYGVPVGKWKLREGGTDKTKEYDFDFDLVYFKEQDQNESVPMSGDTSLLQEYSNIVFSSPSGGEQKMFELTRKVNYPMSAMEKDIQGTVVVRFVVNEDGSLSDFAIFQSAHPILDKAALEVVRSFPKYNPGTIDNRPVKMYHLVPFNFKLG